MPRMEFQSSGASTWAKALQEYAATAENALIAARNNFVRYLTESIMALTPVWEGDTLVNWIWSVGSPSGELIQPIDNGAPGHTNTMALGSEPRRAVNEEIVRRTLESVLSEAGLDDLYLTNVADTAYGVEYGLLPTPKTSRSSATNGVVRLAIRESLNKFSFNA